MSTSAGAGTGAAPLNTDLHAEKRRWIAVESACTRRRARRAEQPRFLVIFAPSPLTLLGLFKPPPPPPLFLSSSSAAVLLPSTFIDPTTATSRNRPSRAKPTPQNPILGAKIVVLRRGKAIRTSEKAGRSETRIEQGLNRGEIGEKQ